MIAPRPLRPARAAVLVIAVIAVIAAPAAPGAPRAHAEGRSGTALVEYAPRSLAVPLSAAGPGRLELVDASGSVALSVRGGTVLAEAPEGGELSLRAVPDEGAYLASLRVGGRPRPMRERPGPGSRRPVRSGGGRRLWNLAP